MSRTFEPARDFERKSLAYRGRLVVCCEPAPNKRSMERRAMGRPERLTRERHDRFVQAIRGGSFPEVAARFAGFSPATFYRYMAGATPAHALFRDDVLKAQTELEIRLVGIITREALTKPRWAMELLQRRFPARWARGAAVDEAVPGATPDGPGTADEGVVLDPALVETLVPRLLEASDRLRDRQTPSPDDIARFVERRPRSADDPKP